MLSVRLPRSCGSDHLFQEAVLRSSHLSPKHILFLSIEQVNLRSGDLEAVLKHSGLQQLKGLSLQKCHSLGSGFLQYLPVSLETLVLSSVDFSSTPDSQIMHLSKLNLRLLALNSSTICFNTFLNLISSLKHLEALLLGGCQLCGACRYWEHAHCRVLKEPDFEPDHRLSSLRFLELTFVDSPYRDWLLARSPHASVLDLTNSEIGPLASSIATLKKSCHSICGMSIGSCLSESLAHAVLNCRNARFATALHDAAIHGRYSVAAELLLHGAMPDIKDEKGCTPLHRSLFWGHTEMVSLLLHTKSCDLYATNHAMETPIYTAALRGHASCLELLLTEMKLHGDLELESAAINYHDGYSPLHASVIGGSADCTRMLLHAGFSAASVNCFQQTPLHIAAQRGDAHAAKQLLKAAPHAVNMRDQCGKTALQIAKKLCHEGVVELLQGQFNEQRLNHESRQTCTHVDRKKKLQGKRARGKLRTGATATVGDKIDIVARLDSLDNRGTISIRS